MKRGSTLTVKFMVGLAIILFFGISVGSFLTYDYLKNLYIREAYEKTDIVLGHIDATMEYARDELRPKVFHIVPGNLFIRQVMSSSFMNMGIMSRFIKRFPSYIYRRVAIDPMNPESKANSSEEDFIKHFQQTPPGQQEWRGLVTRDGREYFLRAKAIVMEEQCLLCHGDPASSPPSITSHYGTVHGRHWQIGEVVGLESIAAPVSDTFHQLRKVALFLFLFGVGGTGALFAVLNYFHYRVAVVPLKRLNAFFVEVINRHRGLDIHLDARDYAEVSDLAESFNRMMDYLHHSEEERQRMEERVRQADKLASIGQLAAGIAHEINNPLSVILGYTKMLRKECLTAGDCQEDLEIVYRNASICKRIVEDLLNFSRQTKSRRSATDINAAVEGVVTEMEEEFRSNGIQLIREYAAELPKLIVDADQLRRVFSNLLKNSRQAMKSGGKLIIRTELDPEGTGVKLSFSDDGHGIPEKIVGKIFEPFFTTKSPGEGTGLGLAVSYGIIKEHNGEITVQSEEGHGATFTLRLPVGGGLR